jgi:hypothetical protein
MDLNTLIDRSLEAVKKRDAMALRTISADANSEAATEGHRELILIALVDYALSKILSKIHYQQVDETFYAKIIKNFKDAKAGSKKETLKNLEAIEDFVIRLDESEGNFQDTVMDKARVKKAANLYEKGLSLRRASELTGADSAQVLEYVGGSKIHEFSGKGHNAVRLKTARELFSA